MVLTCVSSARDHQAFSLTLIVHLNHQVIFQPCNLKETDSHRQWSLPTWYLLALSNIVRSQEI